MATKKPEPVFDFDNFDEDAALEDAAGLLGVKTAFGGGVFAGQFPDGTVVTVPLDIPRKLLDGLDLEDLDPVEQIVALLDGMGLGEKAQALVDQGMISALTFAQKFFDTITKVMRVSLGESSSSRG